MPIRRYVKVPAIVPSGPLPLRFPEPLPDAQLSTPEPVNCTWYGPLSSPEPVHCASVVQTNECGTVDIVSGGAHTPLPWTDVAGQYAASTSESSAWAPTPATTEPPM